ncbi:transaldolase [Candidatus Providencia siddallii]|uniref:Transaldolase n=1 Tax=Candidatus Providencia siddallii TaxID=1715285 RepID=A0ABM9NP38_9GAMM
MIDKLTSLRNSTIIAADTIDTEVIKLYKPHDVTTNPSLILNAVKFNKYNKLINEAITWARKKSKKLKQQVIDACDKLSVNIGLEVLKIIPGRISTEIDANFSYNEKACILKAKRIIKIYNDSNINNDRILIKLASTWQGIKAAEKLEKEGINCNLTLLFSFAQARACAESNVFLISPFIGRIFDWYKKNKQEKYFTEKESPGVIFVNEVFNYYKMHGYKTLIMGASLRDINDIIELAGCDILTIPPILLKELSESQGEIVRKLIYSSKIKKPTDKLTESEFHLQHNQNLMAVNKLNDGICKFINDQKKLEKFIIDLI